MLVDKPKQAILALLGRLGYTLVKNGADVDSGTPYHQDGLLSCHNHDFVDEPAFKTAYRRGLAAVQGIDPHNHWRLHVALWAAEVAMRVPGDFVECGVNAGFMSSALMEYFDWNSSGRSFYLVDSFEGPPPDQLTETEAQSGLHEQTREAIERGAYVTDMERITANFEEWHNAVIVKGIIPQVLPRVPAREIALLHLDMNAAHPEREALAFFWPLISPGGVVLLDDYAYYGYGQQKAAIDSLADKLGFATLSLPTGQGLVVKQGA